MNMSDILQSACAPCRENFESNAGEVPTLEKIRQVLDKKYYCGKKNKKRSGHFLKISNI